jgi:hypothetical protein
MDLVPCEPGQQALLALSAAADLCLQVSGDQGGPTERGKGLGTSCPKRKRPDRRHRGLQSYSGSTERRFPYSARIARLTPTPESSVADPKIAWSNCIKVTAAGHDSRVTDVVVPRYRGQRLALRNPRQRLIPLMLGELRLPSKPYSLRSHEPGLFGSPQDRMAFELGQSASLFALTTVTIC